MAIGPVQLIVLGFNHPSSTVRSSPSSRQLRKSDTVRVIDALAVYKDAEGELEVEHLSNITEDEAIELGTTIGALIGLGIEGEEGMEAGAAAGAEHAAADGIHPFSDEEAWDVLEEIPNDSAAALLLIEHHWAVPLRDAIARAGGFRIGDGFISPLDLIKIGLVSAEDAKELHAMETAAVEVRSDLRATGGRTCSEDLGWPAAQAGGPRGASRAAASRSRASRPAARRAACLPVHEERSKSHEQ